MVYTQRIKDIILVIFLCICAFVCALTGENTHLFVYICAFVRTGEENKHLSKTSNWQTG